MKNIQWQEYNEHLEMTPEKWLIAEYQKLYGNSSITMVDLAKKLAYLLQVERDIRHVVEAKVYRLKQCGLLAPHGNGCIARNQAIIWGTYDERLSTTPAKWLEQNYPITPYNKDLAETLANILGIDRDLKKAIEQKAQTLSLRKTDEAWLESRTGKGRHSENPRRHLRRKLKCPARLTNWPKVTANPVMVTCDWHIPYYDLDLVNRMMLVSQHWDPPIRHHVIIGDFIDFSMFNTHVEERSGRPGQTAQAQLEEGGSLLNQMAEWFEDILVLRGNHEDWLFSKVLRQEVAYSTLNSMFKIAPGLQDRVRFTEWKWCHINGDWHLTHPNTAAQTPGGKARRLAEKHRRHVIMAHAHQMNISQEISGENICIDGGGMMDPQMLAYMMMNDTTYPKWRPGFNVISGEGVHQFNMLWTDWDSYGKWLGIDSWAT